MLFLYSQGLADTKIPGPASPMSTRSTQSASVPQVPSQSQIHRTYSEGSLHRSVSQLIDIYDKKSLIEDSVWDTIIHGHDSGMVSKFHFRSDSTSLSLPALPGLFSLFLQVTLGLNMTILQKHT